MFLIGLLEAVGSDSVCLLVICSCSNRACRRLMPGIGRLGEEEKPWNSILSVQDESEESGCYSLAVDAGQGTRDVSDRAPGRA